MPFGRRGRRLVPCPNLPVPPIRVLEKMAEKDGVDLHWLITGKGPKYVEKEGFKTFRRIPILGKVPAGPSGGEHWSEYDAKDLLTVAVPADDPDVIALQVQGESMYPTLYDGDHVLMSPNSTWNEGDVVVAEVADVPEEFVIKRLGRMDDDDGVMLVSDNFLRYPPRIGVGAWLGAEDRSPVAGGGSRTVSSRMRHLA